ncbi:MAG: LD-carboxypeptidase [Polyangiaceae bacterium]|nr:LD-carboxypeptidase [Polyangiaceae bacterium]
MKGNTSSAATSPIRASAVRAGIAPTLHHLASGSGSGHHGVRVRFPPALRPGDTVAVIAPSGPFDRTLCLRGAGFLGERYRVKFDWSIFQRTGFLAGPDTRRRAELDAAVRAPELRAIVAARGGYGLTRIVHAADLRPLVDQPKWVVGFSDVTALHVECARLGLGSIHAHNCAGLGRGDAHARAALIDVLEHPTRPRRFDRLETWHPGAASGPLFGGNLTVLFTLAAAGRLFIPEGAVLFIEDVTESAYRLDRMLTALMVGGALDRVAAVAVGELTDCPAGPHGVPAEVAVRTRLIELGVPVVAGIAAGHGRHNAPLVLGAPARVTDGQLSLFGES